MSASCDLQPQHPPRQYFDIRYALRAHTRANPNAKQYFRIVLEPIPIFATSVLLIGLELLLISDKGPIWFRDLGKMEEMGKLLPYQDILSTFASPIIMLFLGGFFLAMAATKYHLDVNLARVFLRPFGESPKFVMLGMMVITAVFSMFMSNTATTALMITIVTPVLRLFPNDDLGRMALVLCIPLAANIGGIGTPIGSPPNAVAMKYLVGEQAISFGGWMTFGVPFSISLLAIAWILLVTLLPSKKERIKLIIESEFRRTPRAWVCLHLFCPDHPALAYGLFAWNEFLCCCDDSCSCFSGQRGDWEARPQKFELGCLMVDFWRNRSGAWTGVNRTQPYSHCQYPFR